MSLSAIDKQHANNLLAALNIDTNDLAPVEMYQNFLKKHYEANHFLNLGKQSTLHDYHILLNDEDDIISLLYFDFAKSPKLTFKRLADCGAFSNNAWRNID